MAAVSTNYGTAGDENLHGSSNGMRSRYGYGYGSKARSGTNSFALKSMTRSFKKGDISMPSTTSAAGEGVDDFLHVETRQNATLSSTVVESAGRRKHGGDGSSVGSNDSTKMIIRKDVHYTVQYQPRKSDGDDPDMPSYAMHGPCE
jgi:hypothetical protein